MQSGLATIGAIPSRIPREQYQALIDPFVWEAFSTIAAPKELADAAEWTRSYYTLEGHNETIAMYNKPILPEPTDADWQSIKYESEMIFNSYPQVPVLSALTDFDSVRYQQSTSAGYGYVDNPGEYPTHKGPTNGPQHAKAKRIASAIVHRLQAETAESLDSFLATVPNDSVPDIAFTRTQLAQLPAVKIRNVFGECFHYVLLEGLIAQPLVSFFMTRDEFYYIGKDPASDVPRLIRDLAGNCHSLLVADWSAFDASVQPWEINFAFSLLYRMCLFPDETTRRVFMYVWTLFLSRKLAGPDGTLYLRYSGVPSGSCFTHIIDSIINWIRIRYLLKRVKCPYKAIRTHGDDSLTATSISAPDLYQMSDIGATLGWILKPEKVQLTSSANQIEFLGRMSHAGFNTRDEQRCLHLMLYPEYPVDDPGISLARAEAILMDSGFSSDTGARIVRALRSAYGSVRKPLPLKFKTFHQRLEPTTFV